MSFLKYKPGSKPGVASKRKLTTESKASQNKAYEEPKRERKFQSRWLVGRPWLSYDEKMDIMKCLWCVENSKTYGSDKFVVGTNNFRLSTITDHEVSVKHKQVMPDVSLDVLTGVGMGWG